MDSVYAYCGQSMNGNGSFAVPGIQNLEAFDRRMRGEFAAGEYDEIA
jgi:hypothetical protein